MDRSVELQGTTINCKNRASSSSSNLTLSITFSREFGQSMAKQTKRRSVSGYDRGRRRSYSSCPAVSQRANSSVFPLG